MQIGADVWGRHLQRLPCKRLTRGIAFRWAVCQSVSATGQLEMGIRYFDIRLCKKDCQV